MTAVLATTAGALLVLLVLLDVFVTVLSAEASRGPIERSLSRAVWRLFRFLDRVSGAHQKVAARCGPVLIATLLASWSFGLILGFALIYWPQLGTDLQAGGNRSVGGFLDALYFSGFSFTTLGIGDLFPVGGWMRMLTVFQAWLGFSMLTLSISYIISIYQAVEHRNMLAETLHALTGETGDARRLLRRLRSPSSRASELPSLRQQLVQLTTEHRQYPLIHYFLFPPDKFATARIFFLMQDSLSLCRALGTGEDEAEIEPVEVVMRTLLHGFGEMILPRVPPSGSGADADRKAWARHFRETVAMLGGDGPALPEEEACARYRELRAEWEPPLRAISDYLGEDWARIVDPTVAPRQRPL